MIFYQFLARMLKILALRAIFLQYHHFNGLIYQKIAPPFTSSHASHDLRLFSSEMAALIKQFIKFSSVCARCGAKMNAVIESIKLPLICGGPSFKFPCTNNVYAV
ncbi:MAG: hypothetical protein GY820_08470 [Gammaproteobacteria bacterium]|nr:hypothetical protein [Gammaproteobacteria bacterium]